MRIPRVRFTVRRMMIAVAIVALALSFFVWNRRMARLSMEYDMQSLTYRGSGGPRPRFPVPIPSPLTDRERWEDEMAARYRRAARYPWLPVAPDSPQPE
jgi:hypothetical protein